MTSSAAPATGAGITLVGEIVDLDSRNGSSTMSVRWVGVTVDPTRTVHGDDNVWDSADDTEPANAWGAGSFLASAMRAADGGGASFVPPQRAGDPYRTERERRAGRRGLIRRLIDGPQGRHRRPHH